MAKVRRNDKELSMRFLVRNSAKIVILAALVALLLSGAAQAADKIKINSLDELAGPHLPPGGDGRGTDGIDRST